MAWKQGPVSVGGGLRLGGWLRDDGVGAVFAHDGGLYGFPGTSGWVTFQDEVVVHAFFTPGTQADPVRPPFVDEPVVAAPVLPPPPPAPAFTYKPPRADRVNIAGRTYAVIVSAHGEGTLWKVKGTVDGRVFRASGASEIAALAAWAAAVRFELDL